MTSRSCVDTTVQVERECSLLIALRCKIDGHVLNRHELPGTTLASGTKLNSR